MTDEQKQQEQTGYLTHEERAKLIPKNERFRVPKGFKSGGRFCSIQAYARFVEYYNAPMVYADGTPIVDKYKVYFLSRANEEFNETLAKNKSKRRRLRQKIKARRKPKKTKGKKAKRRQKTRRLTHDEDSKGKRRKLTINENVTYTQIQWDILTRKIQGSDGITDRGFALLEGKYSLQDALQLTQYYGLSIENALEATTLGDADGDIHVLVDGAVSYEQSHPDSIGQRIPIRQTVKHFYMRNLFKPLALKDPNYNIAGIPLSRLIAMVRT
jgi:hypothetical protein